MSNSNALTDRLLATRHFRAPLAVAGAAVLGLSLLLSVGPVMGAANNSNGNGSNGGGSNGGAHGTSGNVKVHDAGTGVETAGTDNEPHVCAFWLGFTFGAPYEAGTWFVVSWAPTGDGSTVASGLYDTAGDGIDNSSIIELTAGHYRVEWAATGASSKKKMFWVDATCAETAPVDESQAEEPAPPTDAPGSPAEESQAEEPAPPTDAPGSPAEESQVEEPAPPTDAPGSPAEESQAEEFVLAGDGTGAPDEEPPAEEAPATDEEAPATDEEAPATNEEAPATDEEEPADPADEPVIDEGTAPNTPSEAEEPAQAEGAGATDPGTPPSQDELGSIGGADEPTMSDTATPAAPVQGGLLAAMGLLMVVAVHAASRRERDADRENAVVRG